MLDPFARRIVDFDELTTEIIERCRSCAPESELITHFGASDVKVNCETVRVEASLRNLIKNAVTHAPTGAPVEITTDSVTDWRSSPLRAATRGSRPNTGSGSFSHTPVSATNQRRPVPVSDCSSWPAAQSNTTGTHASPKVGQRGTTIELALRAVA